MANFLTRLFKLLWDGTEEPPPRSARQLPPPEPYRIGAAPEQHPPEAAPFPEAPPPVAPPAPVAPAPEPLHSALLELMRAAADERFALPPRTREALEQAERVERSEPDHPLSLKAP
ncbi:MAG: hypothetical protein CMH57_08000 [Myxococcales bacterium]|nr:hypothetical protein [Myxococcales bacterium]